MRIYPNFLLIAYETRRDETRREFRVYKGSLKNWPVFFLWLPSIFTSQTHMTCLFLVQRSCPSGPRPLRQTVKSTNMQNIIWCHGGSIIKEPLKQVPRRQGIQKKKQKTHINGHWPKPVFVALPNPQDTYRAKYIYAFLITQLRESCNVTFISQNQPKTSTLVN